MLLPLLEEAGNFCASICFMLSRLKTGSFIDQSWKIRQMWKIRQLERYTISSAILIKYSV